MAAEWDFKASNITLSNSNRTATVSSTAAAVVCGSTCSPAKFYFEAKFTTLGATASGVGVAKRQLSAQAALLGSDRSSLCFRNSGAVIANAVTLATIQAFLVNDVVRVACDPVAQLIWFNVNGGNWNNNVANNPATGVGGISTESIPSIGAAAACMQGTTNAAVVGAFASADWAFSAPSGFGALANAIPASAYERSQRANSSAAPTIVLGGDVAAACFPSWGAHKARSKFVSGNVTVNGVATAGVTVLAVDEGAGECLGMAVSDASGNFKIYTGPARKVTVVALGDGATYNDLVFGQVAPSL